MIVADRLAELDPRPIGVLLRRITYTIPEHDDRPVFHYLGDRDGCVVCGMPAVTAWLDPGEYFVVLSCGDEPHGVAAAWVSWRLTDATPFPRVVCRQ